MLTSALCLEYFYTVIYCGILPNTTRTRPGCLPIFIICFFSKKTLNLIQPIVIANNITALIYFRFEDMSKIDPMVYQPFGAGPRNCIGMRFAILEVKMAMCKVLLNFKLEPCVDTPVSMFACFFLLLYFDQYKTGGGL